MSGKFKMKKLLGFIFLFLMASHQLSHAGCDNQYCGQGLGFQEFSFTQQVIHSHRHKRHQAIAHKEKSSKPIQVANIGNEPIQEAPAASGLLAKAEQYLGQTARQIGVRHNLWCSAFLRMLTHASGVDDRAISWLSKPHVAPRIGAIAVMPHHIGIVKSFDRSGNPILISGNHGNHGGRVGIGAYSKHRILAYVSA